MKRFLQSSARSLMLAASSSNRGQSVASLELAHSLGQRLCEQRRAISLAQVQFKQRGSSPSSSSSPPPPGAGVRSDNGAISGEKSENKHSKSAKSNSDSAGATAHKKKGLWEMASEKFNVGVRTRSSTGSGAGGGGGGGGQGRDTATASRTARSMSDPGHTQAERPGAPRDHRHHPDGHDYDAQGSRGSASQKRAPSKEPTGRRPGDEGAGERNKRLKEAGAGASRDHRAAGSVRHDQGNMRFVLDLGDGKVARIDYKPAGKGRLELYHTEVPEELRGRGIGRALAQGALEAASAANLKLKVTCDYLEDYLKRYSNDKYKKLLE